MTVPTALDYGSLVHDDRVSTRLYADPYVYADELHRVWSRTWVYVAHESEISELNDYVTRRIGNVPVIVVRSRDEQIRVLVNRCMHRGNTVCQYERGNASVFRCAYHGWCFNNTGALAGATFPGGYGDDFDRDSYGLTPAARVASYQGFVFASLSPGEESLEAHLGLARPYLDQFVSFSPQHAISLRAGAIKSRLRGNWKYPMENAVDGYHPAFLHRSVMVTRDSRDAQVAEETVRSRDLGGGHAALDFSRSNQVTLAGATESRVPVVPESPELAAANEEHRRLLESAYGPADGGRIFGDGLSNVSIFPNLALVRGDVRLVEPVGPDETNLYQFPAVFLGAPEVVNRERIRWEVAAYGAAGMVGSDDAEAYERTQSAMRGGTEDWVLLARGLASESVDPDGALSSGLTDESAQRAFWKQYRRLMTGAS
jgi:phenylpropionate dioxygenase-like ring-hydroxylating dioxygenase large terminal subunit